MKKSLLIFVLILVQNVVFGQKNFLDQAYLETSAKVDTLVTPDKIYISININEADTKNKKSIEQQEREMETALKKLGINTEKDLVLLNLASNFKNYFLKGQNVLKNKRYELMVKDAVTAGRVFIELENIGIANSYLSRTEYSKKEQLLLELKAKAIEKTKTIANKLTKPLGQKVGKAIFISDTYDYGYHQPVASMAYMTKDSIQAESASPEPIHIEIRKVEFQASVSVKYILD